MNKHSKKLKRENSLPIKIIAIAISILVLGLLFYLFYFKPKQENKRLKSENEELKELYQSVFNEIQSEGEPLEELTEEEKKYEEAELAYQNCFDKTQKLNQSIERDGYADITNRYVVEWGGDSTNGWEYHFMEWLIKNYPDFCSEYDINKIKHFLSKQKEGSKDNMTQEEIEADIQQKINTAIAENEAKKELEEKIEKYNDRIKDYKHSIEETEENIKKYEKWKKDCDDRDDKDDRDECIENIEENYLERSKKYLKKAEEEKERLEKKLEKISN